MLAALAYLAKSLIEHKLSRDVSKVQSELKAASDAAIERLKSDLQLHAIEHQVRFSRLHEKRATVIAELNSLLAEARWEAGSFLSVMEFSGEPSKREKHNTAMAKLVELSRYFDKHRIYLPSELAVPLEALVQRVRMLVIRFGVYLHSEEGQLQDHTREEKNKAWIGSDRKYLFRNRRGWNALRGERHFKSRFTPAIAAGDTSCSAAQPWSRRAAASADERWPAPRRASRPGGWGTAAPGCDA